MHNTFQSVVGVGRAGVPPTADPPTAAVGRGLLMSGGLFFLICSELESLHSLGRPLAQGPSACALLTDGIVSEPCSYL